jgi:hypothetical protein
VSPRRLDFTKEYWDVPVIQLRRSKCFRADVCMLILGGTRDRLDLSKVVQNFAKSEPESNVIGSKSEVHVVH